MRNGRLGRGTIIAAGLAMILGAAGQASGDPSGKLALETALCQSGPQIQVELWMRNIVDTNATGFQAFVEFNTAELTYRGSLSSYTDVPFPLHIKDIASAENGHPGQLDLDGSDVFNGTGSSADSLLATLYFDVIGGPQCATTIVLVFIPEVGPFRSELSFQGTPIDTVLSGTMPLVFDGVDPQIIAPTDITESAPPGADHVFIDPGDPTVSDNCTPEMSILITCARNDGLDCFADPYFCGATTLTWTATDDCGNENMDMQTITVNCIPECGTPGTGDCCDANGTPACDDAACCNAVCSEPGYEECCTVAWEQACADLAAEICLDLCGPCGDPSAGDCCEANGTPGCDDADCCLAVCSEPGYEVCCTVAWDSLCAELAAQICPDCPADPCGEPDAGDCCEANGTPGCDNADCCHLVCEQDETCCTMAWDAACADLALQLCGDLCGGFGACCLPDGSCIEVTASDCAAQGGVFQGDGTTCIDVTDIVVWGVWDVGFHDSQLFVLNVSTGEYAYVGPVHKHADIEGITFFGEDVHGGYGTFWGCDSLVPMDFETGALGPLTPLDLSWQFLTETTSMATDGNDVQWAFFQSRGFGRVGLDGSISNFHNSCLPIEGLAASIDGNTLWGITRWGKIYELDTATGDTTLIDDLCVGSPVENLARFSETEIAFFRSTCGSVIFSIYDLTMNEVTSATVLPNVTIPDIEAFVFADIATCPTTCMSPIVQCTSTPVPELIVCPGGETPGPGPEWTPNHGMDGGMVTRRGAAAPRSNRQPGNATQAWPSADALVQTRDFVLGPAADADVSTAGRGTARVALDLQAGRLTWDVAYQGLTSNVIAARLATNTSGRRRGPITIDLSDTVFDLGGTGVITGSRRLRPRQIAAFSSGIWSLDLATVICPRGEVAVQDAADGPCRVRVSWEAFSPSGCGLSVAAAVLIDGQETEVLNGQVLEVNCTPGAPGSEGTFDHGDNAPAFAVDGGDPVPQPVSSGTAALVVTAIDDDGHAVSRQQDLCDLCPGQTVVLDFETEDDLSTPLVNGQDISAPPEFGELVTISGIGPNFGPAIFDSTPGVNGQDQDLQVGLGNILILQGQGSQSEPGTFDYPDDDPDGGTVILDFVGLVEVYSITLIDIDAEAQDVWVTLTDDAGRARTYVVPGGWTGSVSDAGPPGYGVLDLVTLMPQPGLIETTTVFEVPGFERDRVVRMEIEFSGDGGIDNLTFRSTGAALGLIADPLAVPDEGNEDDDFGSGQGWQRNNPAQVGSWGD